MRTLLVIAAAALLAAATASAHHTASSSRVEAHHAASGMALAGSAAKAEADGREIARGPNDGALVPLGDGVAVLEFTYDSATGMFEMYVWDAALESPIQIVQPMTFLKIPVESEAEHDRAVMLLPMENELTGERKGHASKFSGGLKWLIGREEFDVVIEGVRVNDQVFKLPTFSMPDGNGLGVGHPPTIDAGGTEGR